MVVLLAAAGALALWGGAALTWVSQPYETPFTGPTTAAASGTGLRPELVPLMLVALAAVAAVLATGGWFRRVIGVAIVLAAALLLWRIGAWAAGTADLSAFPKDVPPGSKPAGPPSANRIGPLLGLAGAAVFLVAGALVVLRAHRMPGMGAKYSAPSARKEAAKDPDRRLWEALDEGEDPTAER